jgi:hypothetical protein
MRLTLRVSNGSTCATAAAQAASLELACGVPVVTGGNRILGMRSSIVALLSSSCHRSSPKRLHAP